MRMVTLLLLAAAAAPAELPDFYKTVSRLTWVVPDVDRAAEAWAKLGVAAIEPYGEVELPSVFRGRPVTVRMKVTTGSFANVLVDWIQPLGDDNAYSEFLARHGPGIFSLMHYAPSLEAFRREIERLRGLGVGMLQEGSQPGEGGTVHFAYLDTAPRGKYVLGLYHDPAPPRMAAGARRISQFAFVVRDLKAVSKYWVGLGWPEMSITHSATRNSEYRGKATAFDMRLGWQRHGQVAYEWILSLKGPNTYEDHLKAHGEGLHHLGTPVDDMDKAIAEWTALGYPTSMSGAWGEEGKPGSGRFAYQDTDAIGGLQVELLWSFR